MSPEYRPRGSHPKPHKPRLFPLNEDIVYDAQKIAEAIISSMNMDELAKLGKYAAKMDRGMTIPLKPFKPLDPLTIAGKIVAPNKTEKEGESLRGNLTEDEGADVAEMEYGESSLDIPHELDI